MAIDMENEMKKEEEGIIRVIALYIFFENNSATPSCFIIFKMTLSIIVITFVNTAFITNKENGGR
jgi:aspartate carbamoyltransferase catalytic subunit